MESVEVEGECTEKDLHDVSPILKQACEADTVQTCLGDGVSFMAFAPVIDYKEPRGQIDSEELNNLVQKQGSPKFHDEHMARCTLVASGCDPNATASEEICLA